MSAGPSTAGRSPVAGALGEGFRISFARMHVFLPIALAVRLVPPAACFLWLELSGSTDSQVELRTSVLLGAGSMVFAPLLTSALLAKAVLRLRRRDPMRLGDSIAAGIRGTLAPVAIATALALAIAAVFALTRSAGLGALVFSVVFNLGALFGYLFLAARAGIAPVAAADERLSVMAALRRSWRLTQGRSWRVMGLVFALFLLWLVLFRGFLSSLLRAFLMRLGSTDPFHRYWVELELPSAVGDAVSGTIVACVAVTLFARLRAQRDGLSIEELEKAFD